MSTQTEKRLLQIVMALACVVPLTGGLLGMRLGAAMVDVVQGPTLDSHMRYLSGLLFGIGLAFASTIPAIEIHSARVTLLASIVAIGGIARLYGVVVDGWPAPTMIFALGMELVVTPLVWLWQRRLAKRWDP